jgi:ABC-type branched-subunit amino acid transport system substrate-binding protein
VSGRVFVPPRPPSRRGMWIVVGAVLAALAAVAAVWYVQKAPARCADGVWERGPGNECVGVSDGSYVFNPALGDVSEAIREENRKVEESGDPWVAIAYTESMTRRAGGPDANDRGPEVVRQAVQGAYLAQRELNQSGSGHGSTPRIKLLLANSGQGGDQWKPLTDQLIRMSRDDDEGLVAVAGFGQSLGTTKSAVEALREAEVPMVGATVAADGLSGPKPVFFRVSSPNRDQTAIAAAYLKARQREDPGYRVDVIKDIRNDDSYNESLDQDFDRTRRALGVRLVTEEGHSFVSGSSSTGTALASIADTVCRPERSTRAVYFAGRGRELKQFLEALTAPGRRCELTVLTGSSAVGFFFDPQQKGAVAGDVLTRWERSGVTVLYTAYAHPDAAAKIYGKGAGNPYPAFRRAFHDAHFGGDRELRNGQAMMGHDAVLCLGKAARLASGSQGDASVDAAGVRNMLLQVGKRDSLPGLSGRISFDERGNPKNKPMALVELRPEADQRYTYRATVRP